MPSTIKLILVAATISYSATSAFAQSCASKIDNKKPIDPIIACLLQLEKDNAELRQQLAEFAEKTGIPGNKGILATKENLVNRGYLAPMRNFLRARW